MAFQIFTLPLSASAADQEALNRFLRSHRVLQVERRLVEMGAQSVWTFCVEYLEGAEAGPVPGGRPGREQVDYRAVLPPAEFAVFSRLRELRKELAEREAVPPYAVFTNDQLAQMVKLASPSATGLQAIPGVGEAKAAKYGAAVLAVLVAKEVKNPVPE